MAKAEITRVWFFIFLSLVCRASWRRGLPKSSRIRERMRSCHKLYHRLLDQKSRRPELNCIQPSPRLRPNCALLDPYHVASNCAWFPSVDATTQYFTPSCKAGAPLNLATAKSHVLAGTLAIPDTSGSPGPKPQLSVYRPKVTAFVLLAKRVVHDDRCRNPRRHTRLGSDKRNCSPTQVSR